MHSAQSNPRPLSGVCVSTGRDETRMCTLAHQLRINLTVYAFSRHVGGCVCVQLDNQNVSKKEREDAMRRELGSKLLDEILKGIESTQEQQKEKDATPEVDDTAEAPADDECRRSGNDDSSAASRNGDEGVETSNDEKQALSVHRPQTSSNTLYAVMALVADLDLESLRIVQSEIDHRVEEALENHQ